jgi:hypothetical protein
MQVTLFFIFNLLFLNKDFKNLKLKKIIKLIN